ncbi:MAG TPA: metallophosphoesterase [Candidatus Krumholzibacteria bacterium]|nr:metallophosphoesterase [Candidatus Krumholzibacteria bacterium]HPD72480.1 metallophosphoesterase [Candidatus Krumholzibacteria bacterium]HRY40588.1 metallophosphoesterase [Candidatus Krumholzibacteria bacterium]
MVRWREFLLLLSAFLVLGGGLNLFVRFALCDWWRRRLVRRAGAVVLGLDALVPSIWFALRRAGWTDPADGMVTVQLALFFGQCGLGGALAVVALLRAAGRRRLPPHVEARLDRRRFLIQGAAVALPVAAGAAGLGGVVESASPARLRRRSLELAGLPPGLAGLRILHFSDVHLWNLVRLPDLEAALRQAPRGEYDCVCVTGDLADDLDQLPPALELIAALDAPLGHFACLGNHEHARGLSAALDAFAASRVRLLRGSGAVLQRGGHSFVVAGIDDPRSVPRAGQGSFYPDQLRRALGPTAPDAFSVLLSHRPSVMPYAAAAGVDLVLAGHTHGGQLAVAGRSVLQLNGAARWPWGVYRERSTVMHVTCGLGQWFPFRLGCPPELVLLELWPAGAPQA